MGAESSSTDSSSANLLCFGPENCTAPKFSYLKRAEKWWEHKCWDMLLSQIISDSFSPQVCLGPTCRETFQTINHQNSTIQRETLPGIPALHCKPSSVSPWVCCENKTWRGHKDCLCLGIVRGKLSNALGFTIYLNSRPAANTCLHKSC